MEESGIMQNGKTRLGILCYGQSVFYINMNKALYGFRAIFIFIKGTSTDNVDPIGSKLLNFETITIVKYKPIECDLSDMNIQNIYLFKIGN